MSAFKAGDMVRLRGPWYTAWDPLQGEETTLIALAEPRIWYVEITPAIRAFIGPRPVLCECDERFMVKIEPPDWSKYLICDEPRIVEGELTC